MTIREEMETLVAGEIGKLGIQIEEQRELYHWLRFHGFNPDSAFTIINY